MHLQGCEVNHAIDWEWGDLDEPVTDWPYLRPPKPDVGMSWRPSTRFDSIITPIIIAEVSPDSSWRAWGRVSKAVRQIEERHGLQYPRQPRSASGAVWSCSRGCSRSEVLLRNPAVKGGRGTITHHDFCWEAGLAHFLPTVSYVLRGVVRAT